ncbi:restriction endonuclease subunit S [Candidatus Aerophobetes bacterium]|nr:restriction endonuclease subunit S [Candidatus Aerophobetes bacterium]
MAFIRKFRGQNPIFRTSEFHVCRPLGGIISECIYHYMRQQSFRNKAVVNMSGTVGQFRVPVNFIRTEAIPLPPFLEQKHIEKKLKNFLLVLMSLKEQLSLHKNIVRK